MKIVLLSFFFRIKYSKMFPVGQSTNKVIFIYCHTKFHNFNKAQVSVATYKLIGNMNPYIPQMSYLVQPVL